MSDGSPAAATRAAHPLLVEWLEVGVAAPPSPSRVLVVGTPADADAVARCFPAAAVTGSRGAPATGAGRYGLVVAVDCLPAGRRARSVLGRLASVLAPGGTLMVLAPATTADSLGVLAPARLIPVALDDLTGVPGGESRGRADRRRNRWLRIRYRHGAPADG